jgi:hypothetical protein
MKDPNKLHHIFGNADHYLGPLVQHSGSEEAAGRAIEDAVNKAYTDGNLIANARGGYQQVFDVGGYSVIVVGIVKKSQVHIGTAWGPPPSGWSVVLPELTQASRQLVDSVFLPPLGHGDDDA